MPYTCRCAATTVGPDEVREVGDGAGRETGTNERLPPEAELLEPGLGGAVLSQHTHKQLLSLLYIFSYMII